VSRPGGTPQNQQGVILIIGAVALMGVIVIVGFVFDFGRWFVTSGELQNIADTAALSGAKALGAIYRAEFEAANTDTEPHGLISISPLIVVTTDPVEVQANLVLVGGDVNAIGLAIKAVVDEHLAGGKPITIEMNSEDPPFTESADFQIGTWDESNRIFDPDGTTAPNAVRVTARRETGSNDPLNLIFGKILGIDTLNVAPATSTAALTPLSRVPPNPQATGLPVGVKIFPMGVDILQASTICSAPLPCTVNVDPGTGGSLYEDFCFEFETGATPVGPPCFAWTTFNNSDSGAFPGIIASPASPMTRTQFSGNPASIPPDPGAPEYYFHGDAVDQVALYLTYPGIPSGGYEHLEVVLPVYTSPIEAVCTIPNGATPIPIEGFISARFRKRAAGLEVKFGCGAVRTGRSGWRQRYPDPFTDPLVDFGTLGTEPVLVE